MRSWVSSYRSVLHGDKGLQWRTSAVAVLGGQNWGVHNKSTAFWSMTLHVRARAGVSKGCFVGGHRIFRHYLPQPNSGKRVFLLPGERFSASEGSCPSLRPRGEAQGCPCGDEVSGEGHMVMQGAWRVGLGDAGWAGRGHAWLHAAGTAGARRAPRGVKYGFGPGRLPMVRVRHPPWPVASRVPPAPHRELSLAWHPHHGGAAQPHGETEAPGAA